MNINEILNAYVNLLWSSFQSDLNVLSNWWMWAALLIPAIAYMLFMAVKYWILLMPIWISLKLLRIPFSKKSSFESTGDFVEDMQDVRVSLAERLKREKKDRLSNNGDDR